jgi:hypothetical protein
MMFYIFSGEYRDRERTEVLKQMNEAMESSKTSHGIKGPSPMISFENFDCVNSFTIDYMHCILLGVLKHLLSKWFKSSNKKKAYYIGKCIKEIEKRLRKNKKPKEITRRPVDIHDFAQWKANQGRAFLLYYGYGALKGILPEKYLNHFMLLSNSIHIFLQNEISQEEFLQAEQNLSRFVNLFEELYGEKKVKFNTHCLLHLSKKVRDCGPLFCVSLFPFESKNGQLIKFIKGGRYPIPEIANKFVHHQAGLK